MSSVKRAAPILPVRDLAASLEYYERLGFDTRPYRGGGYGYATWDAVEIHLGTSPNTPFVPVSMYLFVEDADDLAVRWQTAGADVRSPTDTPWGQREGVVIDPDGNIIRFGSPIE